MKQGGKTLGKLCQPAALCLAGFPGCSELTSCGCPPGPEEPPVLHWTD